MGYNIPIVYINIKLLQQLDLKEKTTVPKQDPMAAIQVTEDLKTFGTPRPPLEKIGKEGAFVPSPRKDHLIPNNSECCSLCNLGLNVKHTDVLILSQFVRPDGCMMPQRITGLCKTQQKRMSKLVSMAHKAGLMCNLAPANSKKDTTKRKLCKKYNTYFDESTIQVYESHFKKIKENIILDYMKSRKPEIN